MDDLVERLSDPPRYVERIAPVAVVIGEEIVRGRNWTDMMMKSYRLFLRLFGSVSYYIREAGYEFGEKSTIPFMSLDIEPDTLNLMIELDYEQGDNTYNSYLELFRQGAVAPVATTPFNAILPMLPSEFDQRLMIRAGLLFFWNIVKAYHEHMEANHGDPRFVMPMWLPECGINRDLLKMLNTEFHKMAEAEGMNEPHLLVLLDNCQVRDADIDVLMKSWNIVRLGEERKDVVSIIFRDRAYSDWMTYACPSVKKLLDRVIAKVDAELKSKGVRYCWSHFEEFESLTWDSKAAANFEQKVVKIAQLSYMPISPDVYVRRKMNGRFGRAKHEPQEIKLRENTAWTDWHQKPSLGRWEGSLDSNAGWKLVDESRPYTRRTRLQKIPEIGPQAWKLAYCRVRRRCSKVALGSPETLEGGLMEILAGLTGLKDQEAARENVADFLLKYSYIHWKEHFLQQDLTEADTDLREIVREFLLKGSKRKLRDEDVAVAGLAARSYYFVLDSFRAQATAYENLDQRAVYQSVTMLTLGMCGAVTCYHWLDRAAEAKPIVETIVQELIKFREAFDRYRLADYGVTIGEWNESLRSGIDENEANVVERCARRLAARHLRPLGYKKDFSREDEFITTNCGHIWTAEIENTNYKWENKTFCGLREE